MNTSDSRYIEKDWKKAGEIAAKVVAYGGQLVKKGATMLEVSDLLDKKIIELGGKPAFPSQISCNEIAAHYCAAPDDTIIFEDQLCCVDVGVHVNGAIGDNALTVDLSGKYSELVKASKEALKSVLGKVRPGAELGELGKEIHDVITSYGYSPVRNLSGHGLGVFEVHSKPTIPNFNTHDSTELKEGDIIAIEPFASAGKGLIYESSPATIYSLEQKKPVRNIMVRDVLKEIENFGGLPFTTRWLTRKFPVGKVNFSLRELLNIESIRAYPPLIDQGKGMVSQAEHTVIVKDKPLILTKRDDD